MIDTRPKLRSREGWGGGVSNGWLPRRYDFQAVLHSSDYLYSGKGGGWGNQVTMVQVKYPLPGLTEVKQPPG
ncbi:unnamed protein product [marine sediment metagenome]|uniref:Uncharacterized protein n=1 Tax=marine sediment metagenome TaxID=412755 RepID=X1KSF3_9ZZZZ